MTKTYIVAPKKTGILRGIPAAALAAAAIAIAAAATTVAVAVETRDFRDYGSPPPLPPSSSTNRRRSRGYVYRHVPLPLLFPIVAAPPSPSLRLYFPSCNVAQPRPVRSTPRIL